MNSLSKQISVLACVAVLVTLSAPAALAGKPVVGLVMKSLANEFFKVMEEGAQKFAREDGSFKLVAVGMNSETDIDTQVAAMENFISQKVDIIAVAPADSVGMVASVKKAVEAGIVVVNFDVTLNKRALTEAGLGADFLFVGPDNADGAEMVGDHLGQTLGKKARVIIVEGNPGADNAQQRKAGFMRSVKRYDLKLLTSRTAHWEVEEANTLMSNLIVMHPDVQGVMCANDSMAIGVEKALTAAGRKDVLIVGFDNVPAVQELVKQGRILSTIDQFGPEMAATAIKIGLRILKGEKLKGWVKTPVEIVKKSSL
ncbi:MAG: sugar ABC transporter substrate-binding protein [Desulfobacterales bacterium]